ncbi:glycosyltransferase family 39 protein [Nostoc sp. MG11]|uniref:glycosyltransferase family 39 protein n=1 Tax=Nostoc sp. MG11 TaxID=2721166 RepID=UPI001865CCAE|nr:glycosyltransferase family 39 protein [Nostoc sp. MG11]
MVSRKQIVWLKFLVIILLLLGVFFRFVNLGRKVYWFDETFTSLRISGYTQQEAAKHVCDGREIGVEDLQKYQLSAVGRTSIDTIKSLAVEVPQHSPLYFVIARFWVQWFGNSVAVTRSLSALISLLAFPCIYWLCLELFKSSLMGWVAIALLAVLPLHVLYAQEARQYSLWTVTILLSSATLLRAMRLKTKLSWGMYAATVALGLYTFLFSGFVAIAHGIYVVATESFRLSKTVTAYLLASLIGLLAFMPWLLIVIIQLAQINETTSWTSDTKISLLELIAVWTLNISSLFVDLNYDFVQTFNNTTLEYIQLCLIPFILVLVGYSIYFLCRKASKRIWLFVLTLIVVPVLPLVIPDLIWGGIRSTNPRYIIPTYLGIQLAVSYLLATQITSTFVNIWQQKLWQLIMVALLSVGILSCAISSQADTWWNKSLNIYTPQVVQIINKATHPLLITSCQLNGIGDELSLSHLLAPKVRLQLVNELNMPQISNNFSDVFLYLPNHNFSMELIREKLEKGQKYKLEDIYPKKLQLWKLVKI